MESVYDPSVADAPAPPPAPRVRRRRVRLGLLGGIFMFFTFFPFLRIVPLPTDLQPNSLLAAMVLFFLGFMFAPYPMPIILLFFQFAFALIVMAAAPIGMDAFRSVANYASLFFVCAASFALLRRTRGLSIRFVEACVYLWALGGVLQFFVGFEVFRLFVNMDVRNPDVQNMLESGRGVMSFSTEPTFYALVCFFFLLLVYFHGHRHGFSRKIKTLHVVLLVQILLMARSSMVILFIVLFAAIWFLLYFNVRRLLLFLVIAGALVWLANTYFPNARFFRIAELLFDDPAAIYFLDNSIRLRMAHIAASMTGFFDNNFLPHGYVAFHDWVELLMRKNSVLYYDIDASNRIMSGYGAAFFELGLVALLSAFAVTLSLYRFFRGDVRRFLLFAIFINAILFSAIQFSFPLLAFLIGYLCYEASVASRVRRAPDVRASREQSQPLAPPGLSPAPG